MRVLKQSHSAEKFERGDILSFLKLQFFETAKDQKPRRGPLETKKLQEKSYSVEKIQRGTLYSCSILYLTVKMK